MQTFAIIKTTHIVFVLGWLACLFIIPRVMMHWRKLDNGSNEYLSFKQLSLGLYRFGSLMSSLSLGCGLYLWQKFNFSGAWLSYKLIFVSFLIAYHLFCGWLLIKINKYNTFKSTLY